MIEGLLFFPTADLWRSPQDLGLSYEEVVLQTSDKVNLHGWFLKAPKPSHTLLFLHGNAGNVSDRLEKAKSWMDHKVSVLLLDYRGFGKSEGKITSERDLFEDAKAGYEWLIRKGVEPDKILVYGESVGAAPALDIATSVPVEGLILEGAFSSLGEMAKRHYFPVPDFLLGNFKFDNRRKAEALKVPVFFIHGTQDEICPISMARDLFNLVQSRKAFYEIPGASHNDTYSGEPKEMYEKALRFFERLE